MTIKLEYKIIEALKSGKIPAFAYDRVSHEGQIEGTSLAYQEFNAEFYAQRKNIEIIKYFTVAESAKAAGRKTFNLMLDSAAKLGIKDIIFKNTDRMSRNYADLIKIENLIEKHEFNIHFYQTHRILNNKSTYSDRFILDVEIAAAKQLSQKLSHDVKETKLFKAQNGVYPNRSPFGYIWSAEKRNHIINKNTEHVCRTIFEQSDSGVSLDNIVEYLNAGKIPAPEGKRWYKSRIHAILSNPFYYGDYLFKGILMKGSHEGYCSKEAFEQRQERMKKRFNGTPVKNNKYEFARFIRCSICGSILTGVLKKNKYVYYGHRCRSNDYFYVREERILDILNSEIRQLMFYEKYADCVKDIFVRAIGEKKDDNVSILKSFERQISILESKISRMLELFADAEIDSILLKNKIAGYQAQIEILDRQKRELIIDKTDFITRISEMIDVLRDFPKTYRSAGDGQRRKLATKVIDSIEITDKDYKINWKEPFSILLKHQRSIENVSSSNLSCHAGINRTIIELDPIMIELKAFFFRAA